MLTTIPMGIITPSTKERLEGVKREKSHLSIEITKEELSHPKLERDEILFWLKRFRELDTTKLSHRRRLIDSFVNSIILYDDRMIFTGNYKDSTKTITFAEIEAASLSSDLTASLGPKPPVFSTKTGGFDLHGAYAVISDISVIATTV